MAPFLRRDHGRDRLIRRRGRARPHRQLSRDGVVSGHRDPAVVGQPITFVANVTGFGQDVPPAGEPVTFLEGGTTLGTAPLDDDGRATLVISTLAAGAHAVTASYGGDARFAPSTASSGVTATVNLQAATTTLAAPTPDPAVAGQAVSFVATVAGDGAGTPTGAVTFTIDGQDQPPQPLALIDGQDSAVLSIATLAAGSHQVTARYDGDTDFAPGVATAAVTALVRQATATSLIVAPEPATSGQSVTLGAVIIPATAAAPTGTVFFFIDDRAPVLVPVQSINGVGAAILTVDDLGAGIHQVVAVYGGDVNFGPSQAVQAPTVDAPAPRVVDVQRFGDRERPTSLVLTFSGPLDPAGAQDVANYRLNVLGLRRSIRIVSAVYDPAAQTVALRPGRLLPLKLTYRLTVLGAPPTGLAGSEGQPLDGSGEGQPGTDFVTKISRRDLVLDPPPPRVHAAGEHAAPTPPVPHGPAGPSRRTAGRR